MIGLLRTLLIIILVYYGIRILYRIFGPWLMRQASKKVAREFEKQYGPQRQESRKSKTKEGEVTIDKQAPKKTMNSEKMGEYIDFEEIDEPN